ACLGLLVIKFQYPFKIFTACHNRIFMFCSAKVTWFMQNASEAIECLPTVPTFNRWRIMRGIDSNDRLGVKEKRSRP
ncbi:MAG: hypothetical protein PUJ28_03370, partial [Prevotellaceae bacterium]|nr:hypothetical protein [Prevotellaceae bacterium]